MAIKTIIYDTDPGIDDAMALLFLHYSPLADLVGITTVMGNATIETTTRNALYLKERFQIGAPVAKGAAAPLVGSLNPPPAHIHGHNGLGDVPLPEHVATSPDPRPAHQFIIDTVRARPHEISIVAVGRMTNLALALRLDPEIAGLVKEVIVMGGAFGSNGHSGNVTPAAEANIHGDPLAADEVFGAAWPLAIVGLDVTMEVMMLPAYLHGLKSAGGGAGQFIWDISRVYERFYLNAGLPGIAVHDSSAVAYCLAPDLFRVRRGPVRVVQDGIANGATIQMDERRQHNRGAWDNRPAVAVCTEVDGERLLAMYREVIAAGGG